MILRCQKRYQNSSTDNVTRGDIGVGDGVDCYCRAPAMVIVLATLLVMAIPPKLQALTYHPRMDEAQWISRSSVLQCRLIQPIPSFGRAIFDRSAGQPLRFYLQTLANPMEKGQASLRAVAPRWNPDLPEGELGMIQVSEGEFPVELDPALSTRVLAELYKGKSPQVLRRSWYGDDEGIEVALSSVSFRAAYKDYRRCLAELLPVGFDELERSRVLFASDEFELTAEARARLDMIARFAMADKELREIFIDGHTDNTHTRRYNVELSKNRAEAVLSYLVARGVSPNMVKLRYHGERFPVATNTTEAGKATNRRVTIRLDRSLPQFSRK